MKLLYRANDIIEAHIIAGMLQSQDIPAWVGGHYLQGGVGEAVISDFATVMVTDDDLATARTILDGYLQRGEGQEDDQTQPSGEWKPAYSG